MKRKITFHNEIINDFFLNLVRLEMEINRLTTTQDMFLERVGITNSFNDDNEYRYAPFFVIHQSIL